MKPGDLVSHKSNVSGKPGIVVDVIEKKVWRTHVQGKRVNWDNADPEPHAVVLFPWNDGTIDVPFLELEVIDEAS